MKKKYIEISYPHIMEHLLSEYELEPYTKILKLLTHNMLRNRNKLYSWFWTKLHNIFRKLLHKTKMLHYFTYLLQNGIHLGLTIEDQQLLQMY